MVGSSSGKKRIKRTWNSIHWKSYSALSILNPNMNTTTMNTYYPQSSSSPNLHQSTSSLLNPPQPSLPNATLQQPIAIPATSSSLGSPFLRAYPIELSAYNIPAPTFLSFLDELNRLMVVSPPVKVVGLGGDIVSMVPLATAQIVGSAVSAAATVTKIGMSKGRSELFLREANANIFGPRGLKVNIVKLEVVAKAAEIPILDAAGKVKKDARLLAPINSANHGLSGQYRRLMAFAPYTSPLEALPDEHKDTPTNVIDKMHAYASDRQRISEERKVLEKREKADRKGKKDTHKAQREYEKEMAKLDSEEDKVRRKEKKLEKMESELRKLDEEREKVTREYEKEVGKDGRWSVKKDKEEAAVRKILWLLVQREDAGAPSAQSQDTLQYWNTSARYQDDVARYKAQGSPQSAEAAQYQAPATQHLNTGPYLGNGQYERYQIPAQHQGSVPLQSPPPYQDSMRYQSDV
jgi:hypothetical protein